jgi:hypothetical protein
MSEFELRRRLGALRKDREPERDLWSAIAARLDAPAGVAPAARPTRSVLRRYAPFAMAAGVALFALLGVMTKARHEVALAEQARAEAATRVAAEIASLDANYRGAEAELAKLPSPPETRAVPALENASATLQTAEAELRGSLAAEPRAEFLLELLARAKSKQVAVERLKRTS